MVQVYVGDPPRVFGWRPRCPASTHFARSMPLTGIAGMVVAAAVLVVMLGAYSGPAKERKHFSEDATHVQSKDSERLRHK